MPEHPISAASPPSLDFDDGKEHRSASFREVIDEFGCKRVAFILALEFMVRGLLAEGINGLLLPFLKDELYVTDSAKFQQYQSVVSLAWAVAKPVMGLLSDAVPLFGYHKRFYIVGASLLGTVSLTWASTVGVTGANAANSDALATQFAVAAFLVMSCIVSLDILVQSTYSSVVRDRGQVGSALLTYAYGSQALGGIVSALAVGALADAGKVRLMLWALIPVFFMTMVPAWFNWASEERIDGSKAEPDAKSSLLRPQPSATYGGTDTDDIPVIPTVTGLGNERVEHRHERDCGFLSPYLIETLRHHPDLIVLTVLIGVVGLMVGLVVMTQSRLVALLFTYTCLSLLTWLCFRWMSLMQARALLGLVIANAAGLSISGATSYFYLAREQCVPGGPSFDYKFFTSTVSIIGAISTGVGLAIFHRYMSHKSYRWVVAVTVVFAAFVSLGDVVIITRFNRTHLGVSDRTAFLLSNAMVQSAVNMIGSMPLILLMARLCPPRVEAVTFAILAGLANLGSTAGSVGGQFLIEFVGIRSQLPCDFAALPYLVVFVSIIVPLAFLPSVYWLLPAKRMSQPLTS